MYLIIDTDTPFTDDNGRDIQPLLTLASEHGGRVQVIEDDHCLVPLLKKCQPAGRPDDAVQVKYEYTHHLFPELLEALKGMATPVMP